MMDRQEESAASKGLAAAAFWPQLPADNLSPPVPFSSAGCCASCRGGEETPELYGSFFFFLRLGRRSSGRGYGG